jgi:Site-specific DNA methylase
MRTLSDIITFIKSCPDYEIFVIDLFCGAGGETSGIEKAKLEGKKVAKVIIGINHDTNAILSAEENNQDILYFIEDIRTIGLIPIISVINAIRKYHPNSKIMLHASLECTNFSKAKGGQPRDADSRTLAEHLFRYIDAIDPDYIQIENVEEFMCWGDMDENGKPISKDKGRSYERWKRQVMRYGYDFDFRILNAADYAAYTTRKRFFGIFAKKGLPIVFPQPTHASRKKLLTAQKKYSEKQLSLFSEPQNKEKKLKPWNGVKDVLDFSDEGKTIFRNPPLAENTYGRVYAGLIKFPGGGKDAFLSRYNTVRPQDTCKSVDEPCGVLTTNNRFAKVQVSFLSKQFSGHPDSKNISVNEPAGAITCKDHHAFVSAYYGNGHNHSVDEPAPTITCKDRLALIDSRFLCSYSFKDSGKDINKPCPTLLTKDRLSLISPFFANYYSGGGQHSDINDPCPGVTTIPKQRLVNPVFIDQQYGQSKPTTTDKPLGCLTQNPKYNLVSCKPWVMNTNFGNVGSSIDDPAQTITANRKWHYLMNPQFKSTGGNINDPCFTLIARMDKRPPYLIEASGNGDFPSFIKATDQGLVYEIYDTDSPMIKKIKEFMALYGIVDIKMRMLRIPELKRIMGFPEDYVLIGSQADQKKFIGNAVEVNMARVLCEALCKKLRELKKNVA